MNIIQACPCCDSNKLFNFFNHDNVPVNQHIPSDTISSALKIKRGDLSLAVCKTCSFIFNQAFDLSNVNYGTDYDNRQDYSEYFNEYTTSLVNKLLIENKIRNRRIIEIGCGKGSFLKKLIEKKNFKNRGIGFDTSYEGPEELFEGRLKFKKSYYSSNFTEIHPDVIISRHVIEHVPNPVTLLNTIREGLINSKNGRMFIETPNVEWILENHVIWDFFYEHCSYFTIDSLVTVCQNAGLDVINIEKLFKGQYLWLEGSITSEAIKTKKKAEKILKLTKNFAKNHQTFKEKWQAKVQKLSSKGKVAIWGAGAKGVTFLNMLDKDRKLVDCIIDLNPHKQEKFVTGTGHPIVGYPEITKRKIKSIIVMNPNYFNEIKKLVNDENIPVNVIQ